MFGALQEYGVLPLGSTDFTEDHLAIARAAGALAAYGVEARHLRSFRTAADREIGLAQQVRAPPRRPLPGAGRWTTRPPRCCGTASHSMSRWFVRACPADAVGLSWSG